MLSHDDHRLSDAKALPIHEIVARLGIAGLKKMGHELTGPCPLCGGTDRFSVNPRKGQFLCRRCDGKGDGIALVMWHMGLDFSGALDWLCGPAREMTEAERAAERQRQAKRTEADRRADVFAAKERAKVKELAWEFWEKAIKDPEGSPVRDYLTLRGIRPELLVQMPVCLRYHPDLPYMVKEEGAWHELHRGPAMLAAIQNVDGHFSALHRTWLDLDQPKGKLHLMRDGAALDAKKVLGSKKGGAIRLATPRGAEVLVMGEGVETTLSALVAGVFPGAAFWAGVDLGNMAGRKQSGVGLKYAGLPDMQDADAFVPPSWVRRLIYVMDGDSDPRDTRSKLEAGLRRAMVLRPGLVGQLAVTPAGYDLNDLLMLDPVQPDPVSPDEVAP